MTSPNNHPQSQTGRKIIAPTFRLGGIVICHPFAVSDTWARGAGTGKFAMISSSVVLRHTTIASHGDIAQRTHPKPTPAEIALGQLSRRENVDVAEARLA
jgi:hypothetical protein